MTGDRGGVGETSSRSGRRCPICGEPMDDARPQAKYDRPACRAEASRLGRLLAGEPCDGMTSIADWLDRRRLRRPLRPT
jgi:hypothetical protein